MSEIGENLSEEVLGQQGESPERGRPGNNPPDEPQPGLHPGAGEASEDEPEQGEPAQGFGEPDSY